MLLIPRQHENPVRHLQPPRRRSAVHRPARPPDPHPPRRPDHRRLRPGHPSAAPAPTANPEPKICPAARFAAAFHRRAGPDTLPVVLAGPGEVEQAMAAPVLAALPDAIDLVGRLTLPEAAACL